MVFGRARVSVLQLGEYKVVVNMTPNPMSVVQGWFPLQRQETPGDSFISLPCSLPLKCFGTRQGADRQTAESPIFPCSLSLLWLLALPTPFQQQPRLLLLLFPFTSPSSNLTHPSYCCQRAGGPRGEEGHPSLHFTPLLSSLSGIHGALSFSVLSPEPYRGSPSSLLSSPPPKALSSQ